MLVYSHSHFHIDTSHHSMKGTVTVLEDVVKGLHVTDVHIKVRVCRELRRVIYSSIKLKLLLVQSHRKNLCTYCCGYHGNHRSRDLINHHVHVILRCREARPPTPLPLLLVPAPQAAAAVGRYRGWSSSLLSSLVIAMVGGRGRWSSVVAIVVVVVILVGRCRCQSVVSHHRCGCRPLP